MSDNQEIEDEGKFFLQAETTSISSSGLYRGQFYEFHVPPFRSTFSLKNFYPTTNNLKKFFDFTNFWRIAGPKTKLVDFRAKFPPKMAIIAGLSHLS